jgi:putative acetyltransferase
MMTASGIDIRAFEPQDAQAFRELNEEWIIKHFGLEETDRKVLNDPERYVLRPGGHIFMAFSEDGQAIGCCALIPTGEQGVFELAKMSVAPAYRGNGIGRRILEHAIEQARLFGASALVLESNDKLANAVHLYESLGFVHRPPGSVPESPYARSNVKMKLQF